MLRAVIDANVVVSALIRPEGPPGKVVARSLRGDEVRAIVSPAILEEYRRALAYPKVRRALKLTPAESAAWIDALTLLSDVVPGERKVAVVAADPDDDKYFSAALEGRAAFIVTGDGHLLDVGTYEGVRVVTPRQFVELLDKA